MDLTVNEVSVSRKPLLVFPKIKSHVTHFTFRTLNNLFPACIFGYCLKEISFYFTEVYPLNRPRNQQKVHTHTHTHTHSRWREPQISGVWPAQEAEGIQCGGNKRTRVGELKMRS